MFRAPRNVLRLSYSYLPRVLFRKPPVCSASGVRAARFALLTLTLRPRTRIRLKGDVRGQPLKGRGGAEQINAMMKIILKPLRSVTLTVEASSGGRLRRSKN